jgi:hypothetical protein
MPGMRPRLPVALACMPVLPARERGLRAAAGQRVRDRRRSRGHARRRIPGRGGRWRRERPGRPQFALKTCTRPAGTCGGVPAGIPIALPVTHRPAPPAAAADWTSCGPLVGLPRPGRRIRRPGRARRAAAHAGELRTADRGEGICGDRRGVAGWQRRSGRARKPAKITLPEDLRGGFSLPSLLLARRLAVFLRRGLAISDEVLWARPVFGVLRLPHNQGRPSRPLPMPSMPAAGLGALITVPFMWPSGTSDDADDPVADFDHFAAE